ncbi:SHOCT domain-containing protein [Halosimplex halophilum]|uniref:SHOCT domain-containing protein n=1 Tax=Halosimplex halophilum TaxID=2559572 RepID=UPI00107FBF21|nr:SHOCT domain-containing protein [Halosimplex halophilum]
MATDNTDRRVVWIALAVVAALVVIPSLGMGFGVMGFGPMMGGHGMWGETGMAPGWLLLVGLLMQLLFLAALISGVYLVYRVVVGRDGDGTDPALEELRLAYARGDLSEEEYERRRDRLESSADPPQSDDHH